MIQWLRFLTSNAGGLGSSPGQGTRSYMPQLRPGEYIHFLKKRKESNTVETEEGMMNSAWESQRVHLT